MKTHDRTSFFKYCTANTAVAILSSHKLRWSSPLKFNDPFDHIFSIAMEDSAETHKEWFVDECDRIVFGEEQPIITHPGTFSELLLMLRGAAHGLDRTEVRREWALGFDEGIVRASDYLSGVNDWWLKAARIARLFCVSEDGLNVPMWAHYSGDHSGAVLELGCIEELDTPLCAARRVEYRDTMPKLGSYKDMLMHALGRGPEPSSAQLYYALAYVKSSQWSYEKEWRCITSSDEEGLVGDYPFFPEELIAVYFGCRVSSEDRERLLGLVESEFLRAKAFQLSVHESEYTLISKKLR